MLGTRAPPHPTPHKALRRVGPLSYSSETVHESLKPHQCYHRTVRLIPEEMALWIMDYKRIVANPWQERIPDILFSG